MKTKHFFFLLLVGFMFHLNSIAQTNNYRSYFGNEFTHWYSYLSFYDVWQSVRYSVNNQDTLLNNGIKYKKVFEYHTLQNIDTWNPNYCFGIREEIETGSLFIIPDNFSELMVSKMDLEIGDKYYFPSYRTDFNNPYCSHCFNEVQSDENGYYATVDSIFYKDNRKHIQFDAIYFVMEFEIPLTFIEGIGPNVSFEPLFEESWAVCFNCYEDEKGLWKSDIKSQYTDFSKYECFREIESLPKIDIDFPLKLIQRKGEIELQQDAGDFVSGWVYVYSIQGELLYVQTVKRNTNIIIPTSGFSKGTYIIQLIEEKTKKSWNRKIIL